MARSPGELTFAIMDHLERHARPAIVAEEPQNAG